jgi:DNA-binding transcriptional regulator YiaG
MGVRRPQGCWFTMPLTRQRVEPRLRAGHRAMLRLRLEVKVSTNELDAEKRLWHRFTRMAMKLPQGVTPEKFARTLKEWRAEKGFSQRDAAEHLGISKRTLENWEQGRATPRGYAVVALMQLLGQRSPSKDESR